WGKVGVNVVVQDGQAIDNGVRLVSGLESGRYVYLTPDINPVTDQQNRLPAYFASKFLGSHVNRIKKVSVAEVPSRTRKRAWEGSRKRTGHGKVGRTLAPTVSADDQIVGRAFEQALVPSTLVTDLGRQLQ